MDLIKSEIAKCISKIINIDEFDIYSDLTYPPVSTMGDISYPCFKLAKILKAKPAEIASNVVIEISKKIKNIIFVENVKNTGPYINFFIDKGVLFNFVISKISEPDNKFYKFDKNNKTVLVEYSSPNIAKPIAFHHIRSTVIGNIISNIYDRCGYNVKRINYLGDWGTQFGKLITAFEKFGNNEALNTDGVKHLLNIYVKYHKELESNPDLDDISRNWFSKTENKDEKALEYWTLFRDISIKEFKKIYERLNINFTSFEGESFYKDVLGNTVNLLNEKIGLKTSDGALVLDLEKDNLGIVLIKKTDGSTLYITRDIAAAIDRWNRFNFEESIYVVAHQQELHFKQFFKILNALGYAWADKCKHVPFGLLQLDDKKMSTREGTLIFLEDVLDKAVLLAKDLINAKNPYLENKDEIAEKIGVGAIIFNDVSKKRIQNINFKWEEVLNFDGETSPYIQYTYARASNILRKAEFNNNYAKTNLNYKLNDDEFEIIKIISCFKQKLLEAKNECEPFVISRYLLDLCKSFNRYYYKENILSNSNQENKKAKLNIVLAVKCLIAECLDILGIATIERM